MSGRLLTCYAPLRRSPSMDIAVHNAAPRLACVKPAASVHPEPGSNSSLYNSISLFVCPASLTLLALLLFACLYLFPQPFQSTSNISFRGDFSPQNELENVEIVGVEPTTLCLQSRCSSQLSYTPFSFLSVDFFVGLRFGCRSFTQVNSLIPHSSASNSPRNKLQTSFYFSVDFFVGLAPK